MADDTVDMTVRRLYELQIAKTNHESTTITFDMEKLNYQGFVLVKTQDTYKFASTCLPLIDVDCIVGENCAVPIETVKALVVAGFDFENEHTPKCGGGFSDQRRRMRKTQFRLPSKPIWQGKKLFPEICQTTCTDSCGCRFYRTMCKHCQALPWTQIQRTANLIFVFYSIYSFYIP